ncbi:hypothetical protein ELI_1091 [Eubacterium callanderi]|uniref:Uncharacterized protein n=1 Tax=Eubacterium callanderi TaxID=53442 RepID=E3GKP1_9FIRM|nr:hypothetical protein ELI_1091 [Eubacterium callanderi]
MTAFILTDFHSKLKDIFQKKGNGTVMIKNGAAFQIYFNLIEGAI